MDHVAIRRMIEAEPDDQKRLALLRKHYPEKFRAAMTRREPHPPSRSKYQPHVGGGRFAPTRQG